MFAKVVIFSSFNFHDFAEVSKQTLVEVFKDIFRTILLQTEHKLN
jgi:hypothetical protein